MMDDINCKTCLPPPPTPALFLVLQWNKYTDQGKTTMKQQSTSTCQAVEDEQERHSSAAEDDGGCQERTAVEK
jgi:hypothetical protein